MGRKPTARLLNACLQHAGPDVAVALGVQEGQEVVFIERLRLLATARSSR
ncbi:UTRA domain-containing protein [Nonomuraea sp. B19D2]